MGPQVGRPPCAGRDPGLGGGHGCRARAPFVARVLGLDVGRREWGLTQGDRKVRETLNGIGL
jgi:hypothetical protein